jgi:rhodanese-related sulfurtransferase
VFSFLARRGYAEVYNLDGGIYAWAAKGYPVVR